MATKRPSFLKRQKELKRTERAQAKREARRERKEARATEIDTSTPPDLRGESTEQNLDADNLRR